MSEKIPILLRNSDLFLKLRLADGNKEQKYVETVKSLISKKGPSLGENNHLRSLHAFSLLTPSQPGGAKPGPCKNGVFARPSFVHGPAVQSVGLFSDFNKTINSYPFSFSFLKSNVKKPSFEKTTNFTNKNQDGSQYTQDRKLKYKTTQVRDTYPLRYKLQTKLTSILFELNDLTEQKSKAELRKQHQKQLGLQNEPGPCKNGVFATAGLLHAQAVACAKQNKLGPVLQSAQSPAGRANSLVQLSGPLSTTLNQIKTGAYKNEVFVTGLQKQSFCTAFTKNRSHQLGMEVVYTSKPEQIDAQVKQSKTKISSVQRPCKSFALQPRFLKLDFYSLYLQSFLYKINRGICSGISQKFSIVAINLILLSVLTIVQRSHYGKSSSANNQKQFCTILYTSKLPNLTMWYGMSRNVKQPKMLKTGAMHKLRLCKEPGLFANGKVLWWYAKPKQIIGSFLKQLDISPCTNNDLIYTTGECKSGRAKATLLQAVAKSPAVAKTSFLHGPAPFLHGPDFAKSKNQPTLAKTSFLHAQALAPPVTKTSFLYAPVEQPTGLFASGWAKGRAKATLLQAFVKTGTCTNEGRAKATLLQAGCAKPRFATPGCATDGVVQKLRFCNAVAKTEFLQRPGPFLHGSAFVKEGYAIKPYYCIKASNIWNNQITATRSTKQEASNNIFYEQQIVPKFQYCISSNTKQHRTLTENATIPEKRDSINSEIITQQRKKKSKSYRLTSELLLKRCFYKYGFFLIPFNDLNQRIQSNSVVQSEKEANFLGIRTVGLMSQQNQVKGLDNKPSLAQSPAGYKNEPGPCKNRDVQNEVLQPPFLHVPIFVRPGSFLQAPIRLEKESVLKGQQKNNQINTSPLNNYINLALYKKKTIPSLETGHNKSSTTFKSTLPQFVYNKKASFISSMPIELRSKRQIKAGTERPKNERPDPCKNGVFAKVCKSYAFARPNLLQNAQTWFAQAVGLFTSDGSKACVFPSFLSSGLTWSRYNLEKARIVEFVQVKNAVLTLNFKPETLVRNTSVSGYQFTELQRKPIATLFREITIFDTPKNQNKYLPSQTLANNIILNKQRKTGAEAFACKSRAKASLLQAIAKTPFLHGPDSFCNPGLSNVDLNTLSKRLVDPKMQYTQTNLDEIESVKKLFKQMGRDYEDYMRQPKDSLPALIISPSLEDDREIEEEGIRIFRKRNLLKKKNSQGTITNNSKDQTLIDDLVVVESQDNEKQNHQILVKNALRQAQEEIDDIAKKEEKSGEKDKQVIPPLTRLEALYTIRQREKRYEQSKDLKREKGHVQAKLTFTKKSFPIFEQLFLYSDKLNTTFLRDFQFINIRTPQLLSRLGDGKSNKTIQNTTKLSRVNALCHKQGLQNEPGLLQAVLQKRSFCTTPPLQKQKLLHVPVSVKAGSKFVQSIDRKHSFFGEMSLPAHKLTAQKQKQVFEQKGDPLVKLNAKNTELVNDKLNRRYFLNVQAERLFASGGGVGFDTQNKPSFGNFHSTVATVPFSLLSSLSISSKTHNKKSESSRFKVGIVKTNITAPLVWGFENGTTSRSSLCGTSSHIQVGRAQSPAEVSDSFVQPVGHKTKSLLKPSLSKKTDQEVKLDQFDWIRGPNRIYFYDNLSQNKACQGSTPKIKATPLGSPVYHRVWQPKRMEPSSFRVLRRNKNTPVVPKISQNDWKNIIEWQLKKHFFEEDKRLWPLENTNKKFKIKKVNLYLPWISITKPGSCKNGVFATACKSDAFARPPDINLFAETEASPVTRSPAFVKTGTYKKEPGPSICYWRLPTRQKLFSITIPLKTQICGYKQSEGVQKQRFCTASTLLKPTQSFIQIVLSKKNSLALQSGNSKQNQARSKNYVFVSPQSQKGVVQKVFKESFLFESATGYSWLFIYAFVSVLMFKQLFKWVYQAGLKDFFIKFLNSDFGRTITSEEFRYSIQNVPLKESYMPSKRLQELFSLDKNKVQLLEVVWFLRNHCQGRHGPRGVLLIGPPGVENISVVQAIAGEAKVPVFVQSLEKIAQDNEPQRQLEQLYMRAHKHAPCVLFLDQLDTIGSRRDQLFTDKARASSLDYKAKVDLISPETWAQQTGACKTGGVQKQSFCNGGADVFATGEVLNKLPDTTFSQQKENLTILKNKLNVVLRLLTILDGITQSSGVVTVATARDITKLDPALLRPKRFDRRIYLSLPNRQDRIQLFKIQTQNIGHIKEMPWDYLSLRTENMSAADIQSAINYSLFRAVLKKSVHTVETLEYGIDCVKTLTEKRVTVM